MKGEHDDNLDEALRDAGSHWRARRATTAPAAHRRPAWLAPLAAVVGVLTVMAGIAIPMALRSDGHGSKVAGPSPTPSEVSQWLLPADTGSGVAVRAIGTLYRAGAGPMRLCAEVAITLDLPTSQAGCQPIAVNVSGVDASRLTHTTTSGQAYSDQVEVRGRYHNGEVVVESVTPYVAPPAASEPEPAVPCPAPDGGWPLGDGTPSGDDGMPLNHLIEMVRAHPERYTDIWQAHPGGIGSAENSYQPPTIVYVVGVASDVAGARAAMTAVYRGSLCVHEVRFTQNDLQDIANQLASSNSTPIVAEPLIIENLVSVRVVALDPAVQAALRTIDASALRIEPPLLLPA